MNLFPPGRHFFVDSTQNRLSSNDLYDVLQNHELPLGFFEGKRILDNGCGGSNLGAELARSGINAEVFGVDPYGDEYDWASETGVGSTMKISGNANALPILDESIDAVLATMSWPVWAKSAKDIVRFFSESKRVLKVDGLLSIYPLAVATDRHMGIANEDETRGAKMKALRSEVRAIASSGLWKVVSGKDTYRFAAKKLG